MKKNKKNIFFKAKFLAHIDVKMDLARILPNIVCSALPKNLLHLKYADI